MPTQTFTGLTGTGGRAVEAVRFSRAESAARLLGWARGVYASGPLGRVLVYRTDDGGFTCERTRFHRVQTALTLDSIENVTAWLRVNLPLIGKAAA